MAGLRTDRTYWAGLLKRVARHTRGSSDAEDLLHSAYLRLERYRNEHVVENPTAFLVRTAVNIAVDTHRHQKFWDASDPGQIGRRADEAPLQDEVMAARERLIRVREGLDKLPKRTRDVFLMHRLEGLKYREIAAHYGISQSAVEKHIARAMLFLTEWTQDW
jgi:RNA polymerase sigma-70 factor (ECF subfamily)